MPERPPEKHALVSCPLERLTMTTQHLILTIVAYSLALVGAAYFTRATWRRVMGALGGGAAVGFLVLGIIALCQALGWWRVPFASTPYFVLLLYVALAISCSPIYLITWRVARRFGWRGLAVCVGVAAIIGPPRDFLIAAKYPQWMVFAPGVAPILADAVTYIAIVAVGHAVMRLVAGPAAEDPFGRVLGIRPGLSA
jgi:hypothetical protein